MAKTVDPTEKRLKILNESEVEDLFGRPHFTPEEQILYFSLSPSEEQSLRDLRTFESRAYLILQLGYFKAQHQFYIFSIQEVHDDALYVQERYFQNHEFPDEYEVSKPTRLDQQQLILKLCQYQTCDESMKQQLAARARQSARIYSKPIYILRELLQYLTDQRWVAPGYTFFQDTIGQALLDEQLRLIRIVQNHLTKTDKQALAHLTADSDTLYAITRIKRDPKGFSEKEMRGEIARGEDLRALYQTAQRVLPYLEISNESIKYYASLVDYYSVFRLKKLDELATVYLLCFVFHRYRKFHDHLLQTLMHQVKRYREEARQAAKDRIYQYRLENNANLPKAGRVLKLFTQDELAPQTPFHEVQTHAFTILDRDPLDHVANYIGQQAQFDERAFQWDHIDNMERRFKRRLRPILKSIEWAARSSQRPLLRTIRFLVDTFRQGKSLNEVADDLPMDAIPERFHRYLYKVGPDNREQLLVDRYEFLVYRLVRHGLEAGHLFCRDSVSFRSLEDDLIDDERWKDKEALLATAGLSHLNVPIQDHLAVLEEQLEGRLKTVISRILSGQNEAITFKNKKRDPNRRWSLAQPRAHETINHPFFDSLPHVDVSAVLHFAHQRCGCLDPFKHVLGRYVKTDADARVLMACLIAWATNMGLHRMAAISDIDYQTLKDASDNFIRLETLQAANDVVINATAALPIFEHYDLGDTLHSSSDGQRFETLIPTFNARHSPKYFGLKQGVVAVTLIANHVPLSARIIGSDDHESHFVYDLLYNNTSDLQPTIHSTDTHGTNEVNFAILHTFDYQFAPRYRDIYDKVRSSLYGFQHPTQYPADWPIRPIRKLRKSLVIDEWDNIQRIMVSLALKTTTQSIIIRKLSSHKRKNKTQRALWEYDHIFNSLYLLDYLDRPELRRNVQYALNRGENYHQLRRAVAYANFGKLRFKTESEQQIWNECSRLITNCIIFYNATLLSNLLLVKQKQGDTQQVALLKHISLIAWQHINFFGRYIFDTPPAQIDVEALIQAVANLTIRQYDAE